MNNPEEFNNTNPDTAVNDGYVADTDVEVLPPENDNNVISEEVTTPNINPVDMLGSMLGAAGGMNKIPTEDLTPDPVEKTEINIKTITPLDITTHEDDEKKLYFATLNLLATTSDDTMIIVSKNYYANDSLDLEFTKLNPLSVEDQFCNRNITDHVLFANLPRILTELEFSVDEDYATNDNPVVSCLGRRIDIENPVSADHTDTKLEFTAEAYAAVTFLDDYIMAGDSNEYNLSMATCVGSKYPDEPVTFFKTDDITSIATMCRAEKKDPNPFKKLFHREKNTSIGLVINCMRYKPDKSIETVSLLTTFDIGKDYPDSKFKGDTIDTIQNKYYGDSDQFVSTLTVEDTRLLGVDKQFMMVRAKNKNHKVYVFLLDVSATEKITKLIEAY